MQTKSLGENHYFLLFTDDYSHMSWICFLENKSETCGQFQKFKAMVENQSGCHIKYFVQIEENNSCPENSIYFAKKMAVAEQKNQTIMEMTRSMLQERRLTKQFWVVVVATSIYLLNLSSTRVVMNKTPHETFVKENQCKSFTSLWVILCNFSSSSKA